MTYLFFAYSGAPGSQLGQTFGAWDWKTSPLNVLVSFAYLRDWQGLIALHPNVKPARTILDSGAYTAYNAGKSIDIDALIAEAKSGRWDEVVALDVIGDARASLKNTEYMRNAGCTVMPVFHSGEPMEFLVEYCKHHERVGLAGNRLRSAGRITPWLEACFAATWPHKFHSFGFVKRSVLMQFPFYSADTASLAYNTVKMGNWKAFGNGALNVRGKVDDLRAELEWYLSLEREMKGRWANEIARLTTNTKGKKRVRKV